MIEKDEELPDDGEGAGPAPYRAMINRGDEERTEEELAKYIEERYK